MQELRDQLALMSQTLDEHRREVPDYSEVDYLKVIISVLVNTVFRF